MGDLTIAQDLLDGVDEALALLGDTRTLRLVTIPSIDVNNPGGAPTETQVDKEIEAFLFAFDSEYMTDANILGGGLMAILAVSSLTTAQINQIQPGNRLIDNDDTTIYEIIKSSPIETAGVKVTVIVQLKG